MVNFGPQSLGAMRKCMENREFRVIRKRSRHCKRVHPSICATAGFRWEGRRFKAEPLSQETCLKREHFFIRGVSEKVEACLYWVSPPPTGGEGNLARSALQIEVHR